MGFLAFCIFCLIVVGIAYVITWIAGYFFPGHPAIVDKIIWGIAILIILLKFMEATNLFKYDPPMPRLGSVKGELHGGYPALALDTDSFGSLDSLSLHKAKMFPDLPIIVAALWLAVIGFVFVIRFVCGCIHMRKQRR